MGPHSFKCGSPDQRQHTHQDEQPLQWGRTLSSAEVNAKLRREGQNMAGFNGAALFQVRKSFSTSASASSICRLQWGRTLSSAEVPPSKEFRTKKPRLQWGRTLSSAEVMLESNSDEIAEEASMGPHSFKCGSENRLQMNKPNYRRFNGAALFQVRKFGVLPSIIRMWTTLQWGRTLSSAEVETNLPRVRTGAGLQWGRTLSSAEVSRNSAVMKPLTSASMGPHSFKCGSNAKLRREGQNMASFNGAALFQVRKCRYEGKTPTIYLLGFNGAALFQVRKFHANDQVCR